MTFIVRLDRLQKWGAEVRETRPLLKSAVDIMIGVL
jgi:hypothetical protein